MKRLRHEFCCKALDPLGVNDEPSGAESLIQRRIPGDISEHGFYSDIEPLQSGRG
jgi:hypothetical protein